VAVKEYALFVIPPAVLSICFYFYFQGEEKQVAKSLDPSCPPFHIYVSLLMLYDFLEHLRRFLSYQLSINDIKN